MISAAPTGPSLDYGESPPSLLLLLLVKMAACSSPPWSSCGGQLTSHGQLTFHGGQNVPEEPSAVVETIPEDSYWCLVSFRSSSCDRLQTDSW